MPGQINDFAVRVKLETSVTGVANSVQGFYLEKPGSIDIDVQWIPCLTRSAGSEIDELGYSDRSAKIHHANPGGPYNRSNIGVVIGLETAQEHVAERSGGQAVALETVGRDIGDIVGRDFDLVRPVDHRVRC